ncbi:MAG TPA: DUF2147 domain-containing protein [Devosia sp.]
MISRAIATFTTIGTAFALASGSASAAALIEGVWQTPDQAQMTIEQCEAGLCGKLSKIVITEQHSKQYGVQAESIRIEDITDVFNKDPQKRDRPMLGLQILTLKATDNPWRFEGEIYNPQDGNTYTGEIKVRDADSIVLKGCALYVLCQEQTWTRVPMNELDTATK